MKIKFTDAQIIKLWQAGYSEKDAQGLLNILAGEQQGTPTPNTAQYQQVTPIPVAQYQQAQTQNIAPPMAQQATPTQNGMYTQAQVDALMQNAFLANSASALEIEKTPEEVLNGMLANYYGENLEKGDN